MTGPIPWEELEPLGIENLVAALLVRLYPGAIRLDGSGGDQGCDVRVPAAGGYRVVEVKSFRGRLGAAQKRQIAGSLDTATRLQPGMIRWTLAVPLNLTPGELRWFEETLAKRARVPIDLLDRTALEAELAQRPDLVHAYAPSQRERRQVELLAQYGQEQAVLANGLPDAIARVQRLRDLTDVLDPDYAIGLNAMPGITTVTLHPKDAGTKERQPIHADITFQGLQNDAAWREKLREMRDYGRPIGEVPPEYIKDIRIDGPAVLQGLVPADAATTGLSIAKPDDEAQWSERGRLALLDVADRVLQTVPFVFTERSTGERGTLLAGADSSCFIRLEARFDEEGTGSFDIATSPAGVYPEEALPALRFLSRLQPDQVLELRIGERPPLRIKVRPHSTELPIHLVAQLESLARVQRATNDLFPIPEQLSTGDLQQLMFADHFVQYGEATHPWPGAEVRGNVDSVRQTLAGGPLPRLRVTGSTDVGGMTVTIAGHKLTLGSAEMVGTDLIVINAQALAVELEQGREVFALKIAADERTYCVFRKTDGTTP